ncbi:MAG TPA: hypothetical protein VM783_05595 [Candidatus Acidoferrum sp.]|nr:hypothetical protein [Candidatus Acidoferrum sp.]
MDLIPCANKTCPRLMRKGDDCCESCRTFNSVKKDLDTVVGKVHQYAVPADGMGFIAGNAYLQTKGKTALHQQYPKYYKAVPPGIDSLDVYAVCQMFPVQDDTGCINHARKKLLVPGVRTGGKSMYKDVKEARDTLNRWLELNIPSTDSV